MATAGDACDEGNGFGGDGCNEHCEVEVGLFESEPNDEWSNPNDWSAPSVYGGLPEGDVDCFAIDATACATAHAEILAPCAPDLLLTLHDPSGAAVATGTLGPGGCPVLDPEVAVGARFMPEGRLAVCVSSVTGASVPSYQLALSLDADGGNFDLSAQDDLDGDGRPDLCDVDKDGDGVDDVDDNCPDAPNGPNMGPIGTDGEGFITSWLALAPVLDQPNSVDCLPSDVELTGGDADQAPVIGLGESGLTWVAWLTNDSRLEFLDNWGWANPDREVYVHTWFKSGTDRTLTLALGPDDGARAWINGQLIIETERCQGTTIDAYTGDTDVFAGDWTALTVKVRDHGGGWGLYARFLDGGFPVTDLELSLTDGTWVDDQSDGDGDGLGDVCDDTP
ncbi:MAG: hypothetical protein GWP91_04720 [Rhodobacterales bacterium]|nr:hypothetical protein [Rhodobacterales bacterium]